MKRTPLNRRGKKTIAWEKVRAQLKIRFERAGITTCELGYEGCLYNNFLTFAHKDKRRYLSEEELWDVCLACVSCHDKIERMPRLEMRKIVEGIMKGRRI